jgi:hypothetical protein
VIDAHLKVVGGRKKERRGEKGGSNSRDANVLKWVL